MRDRFQKLGVVAGGAHQRGRGGAGIHGSVWRSDMTGTLVPGKFADLIILDRNIFSIDPHDIGGTEVLLTLLGGREVHLAKSFRG